MRGYDMIFDDISITLLTYAILFYLTSTTHTLIQLPPSLVTLQLCSVTMFNTNAVHLPI